MTDFDLYEGKSYKDLLKDIVTNTDYKRNQIDLVIAELRDKIVTINDAIVIAPIIQSYLDTSVKNDEQLVKLAAVVQRIMAIQTEAGDGQLMTEAEKEQILKDMKCIEIDVTNTPVITPKITNIIGKKI